MRVLIFHGYMLRGTGSNIYNANLAPALARLGHEVHLLCQDREVEIPGVQIHNPDIGGLLPVYVKDPYPGFEVKTFDELTDAELDRYLDANVAAVREVAARVGGFDAALANHLVMGPAILARAAVAPFAAKVHGSALEYTVKPHPRFLPYAYEGMEAAQGVLVGSVHTAESLWAALPDLPHLEDKTRLGPPGVDVEEFQPRVAEGPAGPGGPGAPARQIFVRGSTLPAHDAPQPPEATAPRAPADAPQPPEAEQPPRAANPSQQPDADAPSPPADAPQPPEAADPRTPADAPWAPDSDSPSTNTSRAGLSEAGARKTSREVAPEAAARQTSRDGEPEAGARRVVFVGKLIVSKGVDLLLAAWPLVHARHPEARLQVAGFGAYEDGLRRLQAALDRGDLGDARAVAAAGWGLEGGEERPLRILAAFLADPPAGYAEAARAAAGSVEWLGRLEHDEVARLLPGADALVMPSTFPEAFGMVAVEAAACGALPVSAGHSGMREVARRLAAALPEDVGPLTSFAVEPGAVAAIAERLGRWFELPETTRAEARATLVETVARLWSWEGVARGALDAAAGNLGGLPLPSP